MGINFNDEVYEHIKKIRENEQSLFELKCIHYFNLLSDGKIDEIKKLTLGKIEEQTEKYDLVLQNLDGKETIVEGVFQDTLADIIKRKKLLENYLPLLEKNELPEEGKKLVAKYVALLNGSLSIMEEIIEKSKLYS